MPVIVGTNGAFIDATDEQAKQAESLKESVPSSSVSQMIGTDGKKYNVPSSSYDVAVKNGWKPLQQEKEDTDVQKAVDNTSANEAHGLDKLLTFGSALGPAVSLYHGLTDKGDKRSDTFTNEEGFGIPNYIYDKKHPEDKEKNDKIEEKLAERDPISHSAAVAGGFIAPALIPGVGEAGEFGGKIAGSLAEQFIKDKATQELTKSIASTAAKYATEGLVYSTPKTAVQLSYGDNEQAAETMMWGVGLSAIAGGALGGLGSIGSKLSKEVPESMGLIPKLLEKRQSGMTLTDELAASEFGLTSKDVQKEGPETVAKMLENADQKGILQKSNKKEALEELRSTSGEALGNHREYIHNEVEKNPDDLKQLVSSPFDAAKDFQKEIIEKHPELGTETHAPVLNEAIKIQNDMIAAGSDSSIEKLQELREVIGKGKKAFDRDTPQAEMYRAADKILQKHIDQSMSQVYSKLEGKEASTGNADYIKNKFDYRTALTLSKRLDKTKLSKLPTSLSNLFGLPSVIAGVAGHPGVAMADFATKRLLGNDSFRGTAVSMLRKAAKDPTTLPIIGGLMAKEGNAALTNHLNKIPEFISGSAVPFAASRGDTIKKFLGESANGVSKDNQYQKAAASISQMAADPSMTSSKIGKIASVFTGTDFKLASLYAQKNIDAINYLASELPKNPNAPVAFEKDNWKPSNLEKQKWENKLETVMNPMSIWPKISNGTVTNDEVNALKAVYPTLYSVMVGEIGKAAANPDMVGKVSHNRKTALAKFSGLPLDPGIKNITYNQKVLSASTLESSDQQSAPSRRQMKTPSLQTDVQRRTK